MGMFLFLTFYFQGTLGYSALKSGFAFLPFSAGIIVGAAIASKVLPKVGPRALIVGGLLAAALGCAWLTQIGVDSSFAAHVLPTEIIMSVGLGLCFVPMSSTALIGVSPHDAGVASATLNMSQQVGGSLGTALLNTIYATVVAGYLVTHGHSAASLAQAPVQGYTVGFWVSTALLAASAVVGLVFIRARRDQLGDPELALAAVG